MARGVKGPQPGPQEKSRGGDRPTTNSRFVAAGDWKGHRPGTQPDHDRELMNFKRCQRLKEPRKQSTRGSAPNPGLGGTIFKAASCPGEGPILKENFATTNH